MAGHGDSDHGGSGGWKNFGLIAAGAIAALVLVHFFGPGGSPGNPGIGRGSSSPPQSDDARYIQRAGELYGTRP